MPQRNILKIYAGDGYYHLYNRGVNKQTIFFQSTDYKYFLFLLKIYLCNPKSAQQELSKYKSKLMYIPHNYFQKLKIICFCLMPNHFHLIIRQTEPHTVEHFMRSCMTNYATYINRKYARCGPLFQSRYKAVLITDDSYLLHLTRYIHLNPIELDNGGLNYPYSSYQWYIQNVHNEWFDPSSVLNFFSRKPIFLPREIASYQSFVDTYQKAPPNGLEELLLDSEKVRPLKGRTF